MNRLVVLPLATLALSAASAERVEFDLVLANGRVVDGTGAPWFRADVGVRGDRIATIGDLSAAKARRRIDVAGRVIAPGFIDMLGQSAVDVLVDLTVFDPERVRDRATYEEPTRYAEGIDYVIVNGRLVLDDGAMTSERPGRFIRRR
jgi:N-acyl-D-aspartate/D-glutamate deacylase